MQRGWGDSSCGKVTADSILPLVLLFMREKNETNITGTDDGRRDRDKEYVPGTLPGTPVPQQTSVVQGITAKAVNKPTEERNKRITCQACSKAGSNGRNEEQTSWKENMSAKRSQRRKVMESRLEVGKKFTSSFHLLLTSSPSHKFFPTEPSQKEIRESLQLKCR